MDRIPDFLQLLFRFRWASPVQLHQRFASSHCEGELNYVCCVFRHVHNACFFFSFFQNLKLFMTDEKFQGSKCSKSSNLHESEIVEKLNIGRCRIFIFIVLIITHHKIEYHGVGGFQIGCLIFGKGECNPQSNITVRGVRNYKCMCNHRHIFPMTIAHCRLWAHWHRYKLLTLSG